MNISRAISFAGAFALELLWGCWCSASAADDAFIRDDSGRIAYIVELDPVAATAFSKAADIPDRFVPYAKGNVVNLVLSMEQQFGFNAERLTSWSSTSFTAFLTSELHDLLARDPRVVFITPDTHVDFSAGDVWVDVAAGGSETSGWGKQATNKLTTSSNGTTIVYVVDAGVGAHSELNVIERAVFGTIPAVPPATSPPSSCGTRAGLLPCNTQQLSYMVGCYTHATSVAGVIGGKVNSAGMQGILPNVQIVSISVSPTTTTPDSARHCHTTAGGSSSTIKSALDWVELDLTNNALARPAVVNISLNQPSSDPGFSAINVDMKTLAANTSNGHVGAFVVQSAGNEFDEVCNHAFTANLCLPSSLDGIMVVGGINSHGQPVVPLNGFPGFWEDYPAFAHDIGSNYGLGVEVWAPAENILVPVANSS